MSLATVDRATPRAMLAPAMVDAGCSRKKASSCSLLWAAGLPFSLIVDVNLERCWQISTPIMKAFRGVRARTASCLVFAKSVTVAVRGGSEGRLNGGWFDLKSSLSQAIGLQMLNEIGWLAYLA